MYIGKQMYMMVCEVQLLDKVQMVFYLGGAFWPFIGIIPGVFEMLLVGKAF